MPASAWPSTVQRNVYVPGVRSADTLVVPPFSTVSLVTSTPLPWMATSCGIDESFVSSIVTLPAGAVSFVLSYLRAPLGSAASSSVVDPEPDGVTGVASVEVVAGGDADELL